MRIEAANMVHMRRRGDFMVFLFGFGAGVWFCIVAAYIAGMGR